MSLVLARGSRPKGPVVRHEGEDLLVLVLPSAKASRWRSRKFIFAGSEVLEKDV